MLVPIRCFTCGKPIGQYWEEYQKQVKKGTSSKTVLDKLGLERYCCRTVFLTHQDMVKHIGRFKK
jgi:DNA-directed RNA polymerase subunit N